MTLIQPNYYLPHLSLLLWNMKRGFWYSGFGHTPIRDFTSRSRRALLDKSTRDRILVQGLFYLVNFTQIVITSIPLYILFQHKCKTFWRVWTCMGEKWDKRIRLHLRRRRLSFESQNFLVKIKKQKWWQSKSFYLSVYFILLYLTSIEPN